MAVSEAGTPRPASLYERALRPLLFRLSPDRSHALALAALSQAGPWRVYQRLAGLTVEDPKLRTSFAGIALPNPIGLAAGFDKNADLLDALSCLGFGFITVGSIMPEPRYGNPFPRLVRYLETQSLADAMGVPSKGRDHAVGQLACFRNRAVPVFANVGGFDAAAIAATVTAVAPHVDAVEISLMCPNVLQAGEHFDEIRVLGEVLARVEGCTTPLVVRVPNDTTRAPDRFAELIERCIAGSVAGIKVGGGRPQPEPRLGTGKGTLHGAAIFDAALANVATAVRFARGRLDIKANGGVFTGAQALAMLKAGACCIDLYSAFIYRGPTVARDINRELLASLRDRSVASLSDRVSTASEAGPSGHQFEDAGQHGGSKRSSA